MKKHHWYRWTFGLLAVLAVGMAGGAGLTTALQLQQTPIDIRLDDVLFPSRLQFHYHSKVLLDVFNNGSPGEFSTVRANVPDGAGSLVIGDTTYNLLQFHFHTPSEHLIDGARFPMEMHLVHRADDGTLLVVGVFIERGHKHHELDEIFDALPQQVDEHRAVPHFNLRKLLPHHLDSFRYIGSLTTPPFTEGVRWVVLAEPIELSDEQIQAFMDLFPLGNSREEQPLNGRTVVGVDGENDDD